jgi:transcriptional regulator with XRE-family HTH domain
MKEPTPGLHRHLRAHRKVRRLTLEQVANDIGIAVSTLSGWERGERAVDLHDLEKLAAHYGVPPIVLLAAPEDSPKAQAMRRAAQIAEQMDADALNDWLRTGERLTARRAED